MTIVMNLFNSVPLMLKILLAWQVREMADLEMLHDTELEYSQYVVPTPYCLYGSALSASMAYE